MTSSNPTASSAARPKGLAEAISSAPVRLEAIVKTFGNNVNAVDHVDLDIKPGSLVTLLGPSGCGKTTMLRMIAGLEKPTRGRVFIDGEDVTEQPAYLRDVTMVFQSYALFPHMNVFENVAYGLRVLRRPQQEIKQRVHEALSMVGLEALAERASNALSGGQQQRVALARALVIEPKVLLFDEPLSNLDAKLRRQVREDIRSLQQALHITSVYVTHDQEEALAISDVVVLMNSGRIEQMGAPHTLYTEPQSRFAANFVGSANFLPGVYDGQYVTLGNYRFAHSQAIPAGEVTLVIRPEAIEIVARGAEAAEVSAHTGVSEQGLAAQVKQLSYLGPVSEYVFHTAVGELEASLSGEGYQLAERGEQVLLRFRPAGLYLLPAAS